ncbi:GLUG motif-containing protein, partial [Salinivirga cyanobacteriivorans]
MKTGITLRLILGLKMMILCAFTSMAQTATPPTLGDGSEANPYQIESLDNLYWLSQDTTLWELHYEQVANIDASETEIWDNGAGFFPIGNNDKEFSGAYNGKGYVIYNLTINRGDVGNIGFFGRVNGGQIDSVGLNNVDITGAVNVGGLIGYLPTGSVSYCFSTGTVTSVTANDYSAAGGLIGNCKDTLKYSYSMANVTSSNHGGGGLVGVNHSLISDCYARGSVSAYVMGGGLVGKNMGEVYNSFSTGICTGGGLSGYGQNIYYSFWDTASSGMQNSSGGIPSNTSEMTTMTLYTDEGWDFVGESENGTEDHWVIITEINDGYPHLSIIGDKEAPEFTFLPENIIEASSNCEATLSDYTSQVIATDNISADEDIIIEQYPPAGTPFTTVAEVTFYATDESGNIGSSSINVAAEDLEAPVITSSLPDIDVAANSNCDIEVADYRGSEIDVTDNCATEFTFEQSPAPGTIISAETAEITVYALDHNGNADSVSFMVTSFDETAPAFVSYPESVTLTNEGTCEATLTDLIQDVEVMDGCNSVSELEIVQSPAAGELISGYEEVNITATDQSGNSNSVVITVYVEDSEAPVPNEDVLPDIIAECEVSEFTAPTASDNCAGTVTGIYDVTLPITTIGTTVVTWTYDDGNGNTVTQTQNVIIEEDNILPTPDLSELPDFTAQCEVTELNTFTATDNCAGTIEGIHDAELPIVTQGTTLVTWTYDDGNGNIATQTQDVVIEDVTTPEISVVDAVTIDLQDGENEYIIENDELDATATDNCGIEALTNNYNNDTSLTNESFAPGVHDVIWTATDVNGNEIKDTTVITVNAYNGIVPTAESGIVIYPNPSKGQVLIA